MISPNFLMSRIMAFALAAQLAVLVALWLTLGGLFPLQKQQVFFMAEQPRYITVAPFYPSAKNFELFKENFIRQYIIERVSIYPSSEAMFRRWGGSGKVRAWSTPKVYQEFATLPLSQAILQEDAEAPYWVRRVNFLENPTPLGQNRYKVEIRQIDEVGAGQTDAKDFTITLRLEFESDHSVLWSDRLDNPFGVVVSEYSIKEKQ